ncbi:MAG: hypothetical protein R3260_00695 [Pseudomonas sp.]|nr:hypothetical protein [Pseudomonas sp.]
MIELFIALLIIPTLAITLWDRLVHRLSVNAKRVYKLTGFIGVPVHELAHALVCIVFGMRIKRVSFYQPNEASGTMGFVEFRYSPYSIRNAIGLALQGVAPLLAGATIVVLMLGSFSMVDHPAGGTVQLLYWIAGVIGSTLFTAGDVATSGAMGLVSVLFALIVSMHAMPSAADILTGLRGLLMLVAFLSIAVLGIEVFWVFESPLGVRFGNLVAQMHVGVEKGLWVALYGAVTMVTMAVLGGILLILVPSAILFAVAFGRGARGKV